MATFNFGQQISGAVGQALDRQMQMADLARVIQNDAFAKKIKRISALSQIKRLQLEEEAQEYEMAVDAAARMAEREEERRRQEQEEREEVRAQEEHEADIALTEARTQDLLEEDDEGGATQDLPTPNARLEVLQQAKANLQSSLNDIRELGLEDRELVDAGIDPNQLEPDMLESLFGWVSGEEESMRSQASSMESEKISELESRINRLNQQIDQISGVNTAGSPQESITPAQVEEYAARHEIDVSEARDLLSRRYRIVDE